jgi:4,5-DOPA dioxygenase extradiol
MPVFFFGHGNPMNALRKNRFTKGWERASESIPKPKAILCISAHWFIPALRVTGMKKSRTIHDFGGFAPELYQVQYPAPGDQQLAERVQKLLSPASVEMDDEWGLDHGTWSVLCHLYPNADVPVVQLSIDECKPAAFHFELAERLMPLREEGILIVSSGNVVHNLHAYAWGEHHREPFSWATRFEERVKESLGAGDNKSLVNYENLSEGAMLAVPTPDHYYPFLYAIALRKDGEAISFPVEGFDGGSISMLSLRVG